jgi:hypothetical protein
LTIVTKRDNIPKHCMKSFLVPPSLSYYLLAPVVSLNSGGGILVSEDAIYNCFHLIVELAGEAVGRRMEV